MNCKYCGADLPAKVQGDGGHRQKEYCNRAHKQAYWRRQQQQDQDAALLAELAELRAKVNEQAHTIELQQQEMERLKKQYALARNFTGYEGDTSELEQENTRLKKQLDFERRFLEDTKAYGFKAWLKKQPSSLWRVRFLNDRTIPPRGSRSLYQAHMKRLNSTDEETEDFIRLWKLMLLQS
jgi:FtsZ-binding cell division protein ZapB